MKAELTDYSDFYILTLATLYDIVVTALLRYDEKFCCEVDEGGHVYLFLSLGFQLKTILV